jgi:PAS domain S-box-containing protein
MLSAMLTVIAPMLFGLVVAATGALLISGSAAISFVFGIGVFGGYGVLQGLVSVWCLSAALIGFSLIITALLAQRDAAAEQKLRAEMRYEQIFDGSPQPLLVHDAESGTLLLANAAAGRQYGWSRDAPPATTISAIAAPGHRAVPTSADPEPFETKHITQSGRGLDVEVWRRTIELGGRQAELVFAIDVTERRALGRALLDAVAGEQRRIGQEMHDGLGQELTGLALSARALAIRASRERLHMAADLDQLATLANHCIAGVRRIVQGLSPLSDGDGSLEAALAALAALAQHSALGGPAVRFRSRGDAALGADAIRRAHLYRIAQEAVQNALKHSGAANIEIELWVGAETLRLSVLDDGRGPPQLDTPRGSGLGMRTMRFRAQAIGGRLLIGHRPGGGTSIVCEAPNVVGRQLAASA